jgi:hypothetical protein
VSTWLWAVWVLMFAVLEGIGLRDGDDDAYTLTNRVRAIMRAHPWVRRGVRLAIAVGLLWLAHHFLLVDPTLNPGA